MRRGHSGLTLLETVIALGLLTTALLGLLAVFISGLRSVNLSSRVTAATDVGQDFLEVSKERGFGLLSLGRYDGTLPDPPGPGSFPASPYPSTTIDGIEYHLIVDCQEITPDIRQLSVEVVWDTQTRRGVKLHTWIRQ